MEDMINRHTARMPYTRPELVSIQSNDAEAKATFSISEGSTPAISTIVGPS